MGFSRAPCGIAIKCYGGTPAVSSVFWLNASGSLVATLLCSLPITRVLKTFGLPVSSRNHLGLPMLLSHVSREVSLWLGEQFAADLALCFKHLNVKTVSANKLLGLDGQQLLSKKC